MRSSVLVLMLFLGAALIVPKPVNAMTPEEAAKACNAVSEAAKMSAKRMFQIGLPKQSPGKTFTNTVRSCLGNIAKYKDIYLFKQSIIGAGIQQQIEKTATHMMNQYCQAARDEFDRRVQDALADVNDDLNDYGYEIRVGGDNGGAGGTSYSGVTPQPASAPAKADNGLFGGLVNWFNGGKNDGDKR